MGKAKRARRREQAAAIPQYAERHTFSAGLLGHDSTAPWIVNVSEQTALGIDAFYAGVGIIADAVAGADVGQWDGDIRIRPESPLVRRPDPDTTRREFIWNVVACLAVYEAVWIQSARIDGEVIAIRPVALPRVSDAGGPNLLVDLKSVPRGDMRLWRRAIWPTVSPSVGGILTYARETIAAAMASDAYRSDFWQAGGAPATILTTEQAIDDVIADAVAARWVERRTTSPGSPAVLGRGVTASAFGADLGTEGANISGDKLRASIARYLRIPPDLLNVAMETGGLTYSTVEQHGLHLVRYTVQPYCDVLGDGWSEFLPGDPGEMVRLTPSRLTMPEMGARFAAWRSATGKPFMSVDEVRMAEGMAPDEALSNAPLEAEVRSNVG